MKYKIPTGPSLSHTIYHSIQSSFESITEPAKSSDMWHSFQYLRTMSNLNASRFCNNSSYNTACQHSWFEYSTLITKRQWNSKESKWGRVASSKKPSLDNLKSTSITSFPLLSGRAGGKVFHRFSTSAIWRFIPDPKYYEFRGQILSHLASCTVCMRLYVYPGDPNTCSMLVMAMVKFCARKARETNCNSMMS